MKPPMPPDARPWRNGLALLLLLPAPTLGMLAAMVIPGTAGTPLGQGAYVVCKVWLLAFPVLWLLLIERGRIRLLRPTLHTPGLGAGVASGLVIAAAILAGYALLGRHWIDPAALGRRMVQIGLDNVALFLALEIYLIFMNSLLEEYVWRWFVVGRCARLMPPAAAVIAGALFFTVHHAVALASMFDWRVTVLGSAGVFLGGLIWSWLYQHYRSVGPCWVSHIIADVAIGVIKWHLIGRAGAALTAP
jgi:hypothetical protein